MAEINKRADNLKQTRASFARQEHAKRTANISLQEIEDYSRKIAARFDPERIILFGSYAYGEPTADSDVDLLVVLEFDGRSVDKAYEIRCTTESTFPLDLLVRSPLSLNRRIALGDIFLEELVRRGKVLYERARS